MSLRLNQDRLHIRGNPPDVILREVRNMPLEYGVYVSRRWFKRHCGERLWLIEQQYLPSFAKQWEICAACRYCNGPREICTNDFP